MTGPSHPETPCCPANGSQPPFGNPPQHDPKTFRWEPDTGATSSERATAASMGAFVAREHASFCLALGDNFYGGHGVANEYDPLFKGTFEDVFTAPAKLRSV